MLEALEPIPVHGDTEDPEKVTDTIPANNPALFTAVAKFLKDNNITAVPDGDNALSELEKKLADQKARRKLPAPSADDAQFGRQTTLQ